MKPDSRIAGAKNKKEAIRACCWDLVTVEMNRPTPRMESR